MSRSSPPGPPDQVALPPAIGRYKVVRLVGEGAMGRVVLAHDPVLDRAVALKLLRDDLRIPRDVREGLVIRMRHEARAAARVAHPNIVTLHDMGEDPALGLYLVFEYVEGPTLKDRLEEGRLSRAQGARLARELGEALTLAHRAGVIHRDLKPENIMLSPTGGKVADFGIARIPDSTLTHQGGLMGTPAYSAPETFRAGQHSAESDQFSLAAVLYEAVSGQRAFPGDDAVAVAARITHETPPPIAPALGAPPALDEVLGRAMAKLPEDRFPTCEAFGQALADSLEAAPRARPSGPGEPPPGSAPGPALEEAPLAPAPALEAELPRQRRLGQVVLGGAVVVATAALLVRTALRSAEAPEPELLPAAAVVSAAPAASSVAKPRPSAAPTAQPRTTRPKVEPAEGRAPGGAKEASADAGAPPAPAPASELPDAGAAPDAR